MHRQLHLVECRVFGEDSAEVVRTLNNMANVYKEQHRFDEALRLYGQVLEFNQRGLGEEHSDTATSKGNLAATYSAMGRHGEALELWLEVLEFRQRGGGEEHPDTATSKNHVAVTYTHLGQLTLAEEFMRGAISIQMKCFPPEHPELQQSTKLLSQIQAQSSSQVRVTGPRSSQATAPKANTSSDGACGSGKKYKKFGVGAKDAGRSTTRITVTESLSSTESLRNIQAAQNSSAIPQARTAPKAKKIAPNAACPCGSGKKYKKCKCAQYH